MGQKLYVLNNHIFQPNAQLGSGPLIKILYMLIFIDLSVIFVDFSPEPLMLLTRHVLKGNSNRCCQIGRAHV